MGKEVTSKGLAIILLSLEGCSCLWGFREVDNRRGGAPVGPMWPTSEGVLVMVMLMGGWGDAVLIGTHNPWANWKKIGSL